MRPHDRTAESASTPPRAEVDARTVEQELAAGRTAATPLAALGSVLGVVTLLVTFALALVVLAYFLA